MIEYYACISIWKYFVNQSVFISSRLKKLSTGVCLVFMCMATSAITPQDAIRECQESAASRKGDERMTFMKACLAASLPQHETPPQSEKSTKTVGDSFWQGNWVEGERGARIYNKVRIDADTVAFANGENSDYFYFWPNKSKVWCKVGYTVFSQSTGDTYPDESADSRRIAISLERKFKIVLLRLKHSKCTGFEYLQMAFPSDIDGYADVTMYDKNRRVTESFNFHRVNN